MSLHFLVEYQCKLKVTIVDRSNVSTHRICKGVSWKAQGNQFAIDFMVLPIKGFYLVLGIRWLLSLASIAWNFAYLTIKFSYQGQSCTLQGIIPGAIQIMSTAQSLKCIFMVGHELGPCAMVMTSRDQATLRVAANAPKSELQQLLGRYAYNTHIRLDLPDSNNITFNLPQWRIPSLVLPDALV
ncbi:hypothetical protein PVK06_001679 [Gossypium arboreum]|uniref:Uncharacterized protein n=1 Tax=Gossypium arboreum TaxID=29729 RepID=A0ABR0R1T9_GOSAR|nr:hypothetical protein PVK06_001679 [Gossypium arboreum]